MKLGLKLRERGSKSNGFTIMELLVVIAIIGILAVVAISATSGNSKAAATGQAANEIADLFTLARSEAVKSQGQASIIVDADTSDPLNYLHRVMVVDNGTTANTYTQVSLWYTLPSGVYYYPAYSGPPLTPASSTIYNTSSATIFSGDAYVFTYNVNGQFGSSSQLVVAGASGTAGNLIYQDNTRRGFFLHNLGRPTFFPDLQSIQAVH